MRVFCCFSKDFRAICLIAQQVRTRQSCFFLFVKVIFLSGFSCVFFLFQRKNSSFALCFPDISFMIQQISTLDILSNLTLPFLPFSFYFATHPQVNFCGSGRVGDDEISEGGRESNSPLVLISLLPKVTQRNKLFFPKK